MNPFLLYDKQVRLWSEKILPFQLKQLMTDLVY